MNEPQGTPRSGWTVFIGTLAVLLVLRLTLGQITVQSPAVALVGKIILAILFLGGPIWALWHVGRELTTKKSLIMLLGGVALHFLGMFASSQLGTQPSYAKVVLEALAMTGLTVWTAGLGGLVAALIKDRNLIPPIALFLAGLDVFLVFNPVSVTQIVLTQRPEIFNKVAYRVPSFGIQPGTLIGPADFFILGLFFVAIHRFEMRKVPTLRWVMGILIGYLLVVEFFGDLSLGPISLGALPALVPIGLTCLLVNRTEFNPSEEERKAIWGVGFVALLVAALGIYRAATQPPPKVIAPTPVQQPAK